MANPTVPLDQNVLQKPFFKLNGTDREIALKLIYGEIIKKAEADTWSGVFGGMRGKELGGGTTQFSRIGRLKMFIAGKARTLTGVGSDKFETQPEAFIAELRATTMFNLPLSHNTFDEALMPTITGAQIRDLYLAERMTSFTHWKDELFGWLMLSGAKAVDTSIANDYDLTIAGAKAYKLGGQRVFEIPQSLINGATTKDGAIALWNFFENKILELKTQNHNFARGVNLGKIKIALTTDITKALRLIEAFHLSVNNNAKTDLEGGRVVGYIGGVPVVEMVNAIIDEAGKEVKMFMAETGSAMIKMREIAGSFDKQLGTKYTYLSNIEGAFGGATIKSELIYVGTEEGFDATKPLFRELNTITSASTGEAVDFKTDVLDKFETNTGKGVMPLLPAAFFKVVAPAETEAEVEAEQTEEKAKKA